MLTLIIITNNIMQSEGYLKPIRLNKKLLIKLNQNRKIVFNSNIFNLFSNKTALIDLTKLYYIIKSNKL